MYSIFRGCISGFIRAARSPGGAYERDTSVVCCFPLVLLFFFSDVRIWNNFSFCVNVIPFWFSTSVIFMHVLILFMSCCPYRVRVCSTFFYIVSSVYVHVCWDNKDFPNFLHFSTCLKQFVILSLPQGFTCEMSW